jgi:hypothetical protein
MLQGCGENRRGFYVIVLLRALSLRERMIAGAVGECDRQMSLS